MRARIAYLREKTRAASDAKSFDFEQRLAEVRAREAALSGGVYGGQGGSLQDGEQFLLTEDSVQVVDLVIVSPRYRTWSGICADSRSIGQHR